MEKLNLISRTVMFALMSVSVGSVLGGPFWTGGGASTEWSNPANWNRHDWDDYNITSDAGATSFDITFNRDGRIYK